jgi:hypothetical protein
MPSLLSALSLRPSAPSPPAVPPCSAVAVICGPKSAPAAARLLAADPVLDLSGPTEEAHPCQFRVSAAPGPG